MNLSLKGIASGSHKGKDGFYEVWMLKNNTWLAEHQILNPACDNLYMGFLYFVNEETGDKIEINMGFGTGNKGTECAKEVCLKKIQNHDEAIASLNWSEDVFV